TAFVTGFMGGRTTEIYEATRANLEDTFGTPIKVELGSPSNYSPSVSADGLTLLFVSDRIAGTQPRIYIATRSSTHAMFDSPVLLGSIASTSPNDVDRDPFLTADGQHLYFVSSRAGSNGLWHAHKDGSEFGTPIAVPEIAGSTPVLSNDQLTIYYSVSS